VNADADAGPPTFLSHNSLAHVQKAIEIVGKAIEADTKGEYAVSRVESSRGLQERDCAEADLELAVDACGMRFLFDSVRKRTSSIRVVWIIS